MRTCALIVSIVMAVAASAGGDITLPTPGASISLIDLLSPAHSITSPLPSLPSTIGVVRLMEVSVDPAMPTPTDPVSVTITTKASSPYLVLNLSTVARQGSDVVIDLYWIDNPPPITVLHGGEIVQCSTGYGIEQVSPTPSAIRTNKTYETTELLGTFDAGMHTIYVHSHGALEGEATAMFQVRAPAIDFDFEWGDIGDLFDTTGTIWDHLGWAE